MTANEIIQAVADIPAYILDDDIRLYYEVLHDLPAGSKVLELGTGWGKSAIAMALCNPYITIHTIDNGHDPISFSTKYKDVEDYEASIRGAFAAHNVKNIEFQIGNLYNIEIPKEEYDVLHIDLTVDTEVPMLKRWIKALNQGGILLNRNYDRHQPEFDQIVLDHVFIKKWGQIRAVQL